MEWLSGWAVGNGDSGQVLDSAKQAGETKGGRASLENPSSSSKSYQIVVSLTYQAQELGLNSMCIKG